MFESPGLYPVRLLFAANAVGYSGLEFQWSTAGSGGWAFVPQAAMYLAETGCVEEFTFDEIDVGEAPSEQYTDRGVRFEVVSGGVVVTDARPLEFIPVSGDRVIGDPDPAGVETGLVDVTFWAPDAGTGDPVPGEADDIGLFVINSNDRDGGSGARVIARGSQGSVLFDQMYNAGVGTQEPVSIVAPGMLGLSLDLGAGLSAAAVDNLCVGPIRPAPTDLTGFGEITLDGDAVFGETAFLYWAAANLGGLPSGEEWTCAIYLSADEFLDPDDHLIDDAAPGADVSYAIPSPFVGSVNLPLSIDLPAGEYRFIVVLDNTDVISEIDETNNMLVGEPVTITRPPLPNLVPDGVAAANSGSFVGGEIDVTWTVRNVGAAEAAGPFVDRVYLSSDAQLDPGDTPLVPDEIITGTVAAGVGIYQRRVVYTVPDVPVGEYRVIVEVNADDGATELENRADNVAVSAGVFGVVPPPLPDLEVTALT
ncbi:MAG: hypothetical protein K8E66_11320, partial [Phycisphaerales bacterium]|nr:hypothetical protein [Phycisphaerales bacterium]